MRLFPATAKHRSFDFADRKKRDLTAQDDTSETKRAFATVTGEIIRASKYSYKSKYS
jgi:hypothetical protein